MRGAFWEILRVLPLNAACVGAPFWAVGAGGLDEIFWMLFLDWKHFLDFMRSDIRRIINITSLEGA